MIELKAYLLATGYFIDNEYLDEYIKLVQSPQYKSGYTEKHHILQVSYYKYINKCKTYNEAVKFADDDKNNSCITLLYKDHCKAHWLLYHCTTDFLKIANASAVEYIKKMYLKLTDENYFNYDDIDFKIIQDYMDNIRNDVVSKWYTDYELEFLINNYNKLGATECANILDRSIGSVHSKAYELGLCPIKNRPWTLEEDEILKKYFPSEGRLVYSRLDNRSKLACQKRARKLGLNSEAMNWPEIADTYLTQYYSIFGPKIISEQLNKKFGINKSADACKARATKYGLHFSAKAASYKALKSKSTTRLTWTAELDKILVEYYPQEGGLCANRIPGASKQAVISRASKLKIKYQGNKKTI